MKKYDKKEVLDLIEKITVQLRKRKINRENIHLSRKQINIIKHINPDWQEEGFGAWNGYGYERLGRFIVKTSFIKIKKALLKLEVKEITKKKQNPVETWVNRLSKLTGLSKSKCQLIADAKIDYKYEKIQEVEDRQYDYYSVKRQKLINKMERENPLRRIVDKEHAQAILIAHNRHTNTDYEAWLSDARHQAMLGNINKGEVKEYARQRI